MRDDIFYHDSQWGNQGGGGGDAKQLIKTLAGGEKGVGLLAFLPAHLKSMESWIHKGKRGGVSLEVGFTDQGEKNIGKGGKTRHNSQFSERVGGNGGKGRQEVHRICASIRLGWGRNVPPELMRHSFPIAKKRGEVGEERILTRKVTRNWTGKLEVKRSFKKEVGGGEAVSHGRG